MKKVKQKNIKGFTLLELLVVVLIIGILAAIALPKYQLAVDKARYSKLMAFTKAIADAQLRLILLGNTDTSWQNLDIDIPPTCVPNGNFLSCDNGTWGCAYNTTDNFISPRCADLKINATYYVAIFINGQASFRTCYAHTADENDRSNRLCQAITGKTYSGTDSTLLFNGTSIPANPYNF